MEFQNRIFGFFGAIWTPGLRLDTNDQQNWSLKYKSLLSQSIRPKIKYVFNHSLSAKSKFYRLKEKNVKIFE
jgi:hypothetical protein